MPQLEPNVPDLLFEGPDSARTCILLAHGAGAPMTSPFLTGMTALLTARGLRVARFEFSYMAARRTGGSRKPPPKADRLLGEYKAAVRSAQEKLGKGQHLVIGGKSMGGRVASMLADELYRERQIRALAVLGYPFHPPDKPEALRTAHLKDLACPTLIVQGERDPFGTRDEVAEYDLSKAIALHWSMDGDHDLKPPRGSSASHKCNLSAAADAIQAFCSAIETLQSD